MGAPHAVLSVSLGSPSLTIFGVPGLPHGVPSASLGSPGLPWMNYWSGAQAPPVRKSQDGTLQKRRRILLRTLVSELPFLAATIRGPTQYKNSKFLALGQLFLRFFGPTFCLLFVSGRSWLLLIVSGCSWAAWAFLGCLGVPGLPGLPWTPWAPLGGWFFAVVGAGSLQSDSKNHWKTNCFLQLNCKEPLGLVCAFPGGKAETERET